MHACGIPFSTSFNVGLSGAKVFSGPASEEFGYTVQQFTNHEGKWLLVGSPWSGFPRNKKGDIYKCQILGTKTSCDKLNLQNSVKIESVRNINTNMSLGWTLTPLPQTNGFMTCGPLWAQQCGSQYFCPGICTEVSSLFNPLSSFSPAVQSECFSAVSQSLCPLLTITSITENGGRPGAAKVMVVVTDGESHDKQIRTQVIKKCEENGITRFGIAVLGYYLRNAIDTKNLIAEIKSIASAPAEKYFFNVSAEDALSEIAGTLGERIFNIEGTGKGGENFQMEMSQVGFSSHYSKKEDVLMLGAVGAYGWSGTVVHQTRTKTNIFPKKSFEKILKDQNHSSLLGYSVTSLRDGNSLYHVSGAPRSNHTGQVLVYTMDTENQPKVIDSEKGEQIGSYFGSVLCPLDVDKDGVSDILLVGAPMFMADQNTEEGRVYVFSVTKGILSEQGFLHGSSASENARFGTAISAIPDLNLDDFNDIVVGAPLEDENRGAIYIYNGDRKTIRKQHSQKILGEKVDAKLLYFGRSLDASGDLNGDAIPDVSVGAYGNVVQF
ncbi:hypothetical protein GJAV_G00026040 [Gymnothorax javanicus]|nr:hypothetical protein GJAV_G00026040 [Gymnothorax javanicus]